MTTFRNNWSINKRAIYNKQALSINKQELSINSEAYKHHCSKLSFKGVCGLPSVMTSSCKSRDGSTINIFNGSANQQNAYMEDLDDWKPASTVTRRCQQTVLITSKSISRASQKTSLRDWDIIKENLNLNIFTDVSCGRRCILSSNSQLWSLWLGVW